MAVPRSHVRKGTWFTQDPAAWGTQKETWGAGSLFTENSLWNGVWSCGTILPPVQRPINRSSLTNRAAQFVDGSPKVNRQHYVCKAVILIKLKKVNSSAWCATMCAGSLAQWKHETVGKAPMFRVLLTHEQWPTAWPSSKCPYTDHKPIEITTGI